MRIQLVGGLIQQENAGVLGDDGRDCESPAFTTGKLGLWALLGGTLANYLSAAIVGLFIH